jgi:hypothetical protein
MKTLIISPYIEWYIKPYRDGIDIKSTSHLFVSTTNNVILMKFLDLIGADRNHVPKRLRTVKSDEYPTSKRMKSNLYSDIHNYSSGYLYSRIPLYASLTGSIDMVKYICETNTYPCYKQNLCSFAATGNDDNLDLIKYLYETYVDEMNASIDISISSPLTSTLSKACQNNNIIIAKWCKIRYV